MVQKFACIMPGNVAKPQRVGHNAKNNHDNQQGGSTRRVISKRDGIPIPKPSSSWLPSTRSWFNSLALSAQSALYEASDWAMAVVAAKTLDMATKDRNGNLMQIFFRMANDLNATPGARQRAKIEIVDDFEADSDEDEAGDEATASIHLVRGAETA